MGKKKTQTADYSGSTSEQLASQIFEIRTTIKSVEKEEKQMVQALKESLNGETILPGVCEFKTYEGIKTDWETVAVKLSSFVGKEKFDQIVSDSSKPNTVTKLLFEKSYKPQAFMAS